MESWASSGAVIAMLIASMWNDLLERHTQNVHPNQVWELNGFITRIRITDENRILWVIMLPAYRWDRNVIIHWDHWCWHKMMLRHVQGRGWQQGWLPVEDAR